MPYSYIDADSVVTVTMHLIWMVKQFLHNMLANTCMSLSAYSCSACITCDMNVWRKITKAD
jgi:hypothetical protein